MISKEPLGKRPHGKTEWRWEGNVKWVTEEEIVIMGSGRN